VFGVSVNHIVTFVTSRFSVSSHRLDFGVLQELLPWRVVETAPASDTVEFAVAVFDLGIGQHDRVDEHLVVAKAALLSHAAKLDSLRGDSNFGLWVSYGFPSRDGAINISSAVSATFGLLGVELIFHLRPHDTEQSDAHEPSPRVAV
jgi:hypothetical protein